MPIFKFSAKVMVSAYTEVEADTEEEARAEAQGRDVAIGGLSFGNEPDESWIIDDADGTPEDIRNDEAYRLGNAPRFSAVAVDCRVMPVFD